MNIVKRLDLRIHGAAVEQQAKYKTQRIQAFAAFGYLAILAHCSACTEV